MSLDLTCNFARIPQAAKARFLESTRAQAANAASRGRRSESLPMNILWLRTMLLALVIVSAGQLSPIQMDLLVSTALGAQVTTPVANTAAPASALTNQGAVS